MRMTKEKLELLIALRNSKLTHAEKAKVIGCKTSSIALFNRFDSWEEYEAHKKTWAAKQRAKKGVAPRKEQLDPKTATLDDVIAKMQEIHDAVVAFNKDLVGWEERKQANKEAYWAKQEEKKKSYFNVNRWKNEE